MRVGFLIGGIALAAAVILGLNYYWRSQTAVVEETVAVPVPEVIPPQPDLAPPVERSIMEETPPSPVMEVPALVLPVLNESDEFVRERLGGSAIPEAWLDREDLVRRVAVVVENATRGEIPRRQLSFLAPEGKFRVREAGEAVYVDPLSYRRFDRYLEMLESVSPERVAALLRDASPLFEEALGELGITGTALPQLLTAIDQVLAVPVLRGEIELVQPKVFYEYADPALEGLSPLQKQVLRMGPDNVTRLQAYLTVLRDGLAQG
jgi:hypothetical protein